MTVSISISKLISISYIYGNMENLEDEIGWKAAGLEKIKHYNIIQNGKLASFLAECKLTYAAKWSDLLSWCSLNKRGFSSYFWRGKIWVCWTTGGLFCFFAPFIKYSSLKLLVFPHAGRGRDRGERHTSSSNAWGQTDHWHAMSAVYIVAARESCQD